MKKGPGDDSVGKALAHEDLNSDPKNPCQKLGMVVLGCDGGSDETTGESLACIGQLT